MYVCVCVLRDQRDGAIDLPVSGPNWWHNKMREIPAGRWRDTPRAPACASPTALSRFPLPASRFPPLIRPGKTKKASRHNTRIQIQPKRQVNE